MSNDIKEILEYRPQVLERKIESTQTESSTSELYSQPEEASCLNDLKANAPSVVLFKAEAAIVKANELKKAISNAFSGSPEKMKKLVQLNDALKNKEYAVIDSIEDEVGKDPKGDTRLELVAPLHYMSEMMSKMKDIVMNNNYGSNVNCDKAAKLDNDLFNVIEQSEKDGSNLANYTAMAVDAMIGLGFNSYFDSCNQFMDSLAPIVYQTEAASVSIPDGLRQAMDATFKRESDSTSLDRNKLRQIDDSSMKEVLATNMFAARATLLQNEIIADHVVQVEDLDVQDAFAEQIEESTAEALSIILDFHKHNTMEAMYREDFAATLGRKHSVRKLWG